MCVVEEEREARSRGKEKGESEKRKDSKQARQSVCSAHNEIKSKEVTSPTIHNKLFCPDASLLLGTEAAKGSVRPWGLVLRVMILDDSLRCLDSWILGVGSRCAAEVAAELRWLERGVSVRVVSGTVKRRCSQWCAAIAAGMGQERECSWPQQQLILAGVKQEVKRGGVLGLARLYSLQRTPSGGGGRIYPNIESIPTLVLILIDPSVMRSIL